MSKQGKTENPVGSKENIVKQKASSALVDQPFEALERRLDQLFGQGWMRPFAFDRGRWDDLLRDLQLPERCPSVDLVDRDNEVLARVEVPGFAKNDIDVSVSGNVLTVNGHMEREDKKEEGQYFRSEITRGSFSRSVLLPINVDAAKVNATLKDGILEIVMPKLESARRRSIKVQ